MFASSLISSRGFSCTQKTAGGVAVGGGIILVPHQSLFGDRHRFLGRLNFVIVSEFLKHRESDHGYGGWGLWSLDYEICCWLCTGLSYIYEAAFSTLATHAAKSSRVEKLGEWYRKNAQMSKPLNYAGPVLRGRKYVECLL